MKVCMLSQPPMLVPFRRLTSSAGATVSFARVRRGREGVWDISPVVQLTPSGPRGAWRPHPSRARRARSGALLARGHDPAGDHAGAVVVGFVGLSPHNPTSAATVWPHPR